MHGIIQMRDKEPVVRGTSTSQGETLIKSGG